MCKPQKKKKKHKIVWTNVFFLKHVKLENLFIRQKYYLVYFAIFTTTTTTKTFFVFFYQFSKVNTRWQPFFTKVMTD